MVYYECPLCVCRPRVDLVNLPREYALATNAPSGFFYAH